MASSATDQVRTGMSAGMGRGRAELESMFDDGSTYSSIRRVVRTAHNAAMGQPIHRPHRGAPYFRRATAPRRGAR